MKRTSSLILHAVVALCLWACAGIARAGVWSVSPWSDDASSGIVDR